MRDPSGAAVVLVGLIRPREHCAFAWEQREGGGRRVARVRSTHCDDCVEELRRLGYFLMPDDPDQGPAAGARRP